MKKLTAGIFTVLIGLCAANSADATVASSAWVNEKVSALATTVSNNATTAADATKAVADDLAEYIESNNAEVALKAAQADLEATNTLVGALPADAGADTIVGYIQKRTEGIATDAALGELQGQVTTNATNIGLNTTAIATLNGSGEGSVSKSIADALTAYTNTEGVDAKVKVVSDALDTHVTTAASTYQTLANIAKSSDTVADADVETKYPSEQRVVNKINQAVSTINANIDTQGKALADFKEEVQTGFGNVEDALETKADKTVVEGLATTVSNNATTAATATKAVADDLAAYKTDNNAAVSANTSAIATINDAENGILAQAKVYAKAQADAASGSASGVASDLSEFKTTVSNTYATQESLGTTNTNVTNLTTRVGTNETNIATNAENIAKNAKTAADNATAIATNAENIAKNVTAIATAQAQADKGVADAAAAKSAADAAQATADAAIPAPTGECSNPTNKCVLTYNNETYTWEVIERANGEVAK